MYPCIHCGLHTYVSTYVRACVHTELSIQTGCQRFHPKTQPPFLWASANRGPHQHGRCAGRVSALESRLGWSMFLDWPPAKFGFLFGYTFWLSLRKSRVLSRKAVWERPLWHWENAQWALPRTLEPSIWLVCRGLLRFLLIESWFFLVVKILLMATSQCLLNHHVSLVFRPWHQEFFISFLAGAGCFAAVIGGTLQTVKKWDTYDIYIYYII